MAEQNLWQRLTAAMNREYERRVRAASLVIEYGANQHSVHQDATEAAAEAAVIMNIPRGTPRKQPPPSASGSDHS